ncbi:Rhodanese domain protein [Anaeromyxobacter sp. K]|uniref:rhodanese-like domain-containing protein n=1 Tax=Anaeromyxobacter sp. (strain K) TaxID=447217 RepID=UPI00015F9C19|nr:rhodanese-like domain-containing protein [Anaeromyxobacter sp. K]ACG73967.1 Rhodanese domain protein [Anaeromyxobacter sp. K]
MSPSRLALVAVVVLQALVACSRAPAGPPAAPVVDGPTAKALVDAGARLVDVRTPQEFAAGHAPGAINVPYDEIARRAPGELPDRDATLVLYCRSGRRSAIAAKALRELGYTRLHDLQRADAWPGPLEPTR